MKLDVVKAELMTELICEESELISDDRDDTIVETPGCVGNVTLGLLAISDVCEAELIIELICDDKELISDDSDDTIEDTVVSVGSVRLELPVLLSRLDVVDGTSVGSDVDAEPMIELI